MKPGRRDIRHKVLITGDELRELKRHTGSMAEAFGLDRKIEAYKGTRPITLYRWDLECLMDVIVCELGDPREYPDKTTPEYLALKSLGERLREEYDRHYGNEQVRWSEEPGLMSILRADPLWLEDRLVPDPLQALIGGQIPGRPPTTCPYAAYRRD